MKYYSDEFKNNIVKLYHNENRSKKSLANEYGVHPTTISHWTKRAKLVELPDGGVTSVEAFKQLQKENQQLKEENEILKAAAVFGLKSIFETDFKRHSEPRLPSTAQINH